MMQAPAPGTSEFIEGLRLFSDPQAVLKKAEELRELEKKALEAIAEMKEERKILDGVREELEKKEKDLQEKERSLSEEGSKFKREREKFEIVKRDVEEKEAILKDRSKELDERNRELDEEAMRLKRKEEILRGMEDQWNEGLKEVRLEREMIEEKLQKMKQVIEE